MNILIFGTTQGAIRLPSEPSRLVPDDDCLYHVIVHCGNAVVCGYGTLVDLDGERCEWLGMLQLSMEVPCAYAA